MFTSDDQGDHKLRAVWFNLGNIVYTVRLVFPGSHKSDRPNTSTDLVNCSESYHTYRRWRDRNQSMGKTINRSFLHAKYSVRFWRTVSLALLSCTLKNRWREERTRERKTTGVRKSWDVCGLQATSFSAVDFFFNIPPEE